MGGVTNMNNPNFSGLRKHIGNSSDKKLATL